MVLPLIPVLVGAAGTVLGSAAVGGISYVLGKHNEDLSQEQQQLAILKSNLSEQGKQSALNALYGQDGDIIVGINPTGGDDIDQGTTVTGNGNNTNAEPTVVEPETSSGNVLSFLSGVGSLAVPLLACGAGLFILLKSSSPRVSGGYSNRSYYPRGRSGGYGGTSVYDNSGYYEYLDNRDARRFERQKWRYENRRTRSFERREYRREFSSKMKEQMRPLSERVRGVVSNG